MNNLNFIDEGRLALIRTDPTPPPPSIEYKSTALSLYQPVHFIILEVHLCQMKPRLDIGDDDI
jgi:hypothetical protein